MEIYKVCYQAWAGDCGDSDCHDVTSCLDSYSTKEKAKARFDRAVNGLRNDESCEQYDEQKSTGDSAVFGNDYVGCNVWIERSEIDVDIFPFGPEI